MDHPDPLTARATARIWATVLDQILRDPSRTVAGYPPLDPRDRDEVLADFNDTARDFPSDTTLHDLLRAQARATPDAVAVSTDERSLSYRELDDLSDALASRLAAELPAERHRGGAGRADRLAAGRALRRAQVGPGVCAARPPRRRRCGTGTWWSTAGPGSY